jgi:segregation and condensation protein A
LSPVRYRVKLDVFEGPFDLLLFLIRKDEVDIYNIPIARITEQFLAYIEALQLLDLDVAGDFIEMVATLMSIKARMLLPVPESEEGEEIEDPRSELVERLIEYKRFKEAAEDLSELEENRSRLFGRVDFSFIDKNPEPSDEEFLEQVTFFDLILAFRRAMQNMPRDITRVIEKIEVTVEQQSELILNRLNEKQQFNFQDFFREFNKKIIIIVTFLALLELIRLGKVVVNQSVNFDDIRIQRREKPDEPA